MQFKDGDCADSPIFGPDGKSAQQLGLNHKKVVEVMRRLAFPKTPTVAAHLRWKSEFPQLSGISSANFGVLVFLRQTVRTDQQTLWSEQAAMVHCYIVLPERQPFELVNDEKRKCLTGLFNATVRAKPESVEGLVTCMAGQEKVLGNSPRRPTEQELSNGIRHAVTPLFAGVITA